MRSSPGPMRALCAAPRAHLFTASRCLALAQSPLRTRHLSTSRALRKDDPPSSPFSFKGMPSPPRLPKEEQEIFESLQRQSTGAFSTPVAEPGQSARARTPPRINQSPDSSPADVADAETAASKRVDQIARAADPNSHAQGEEQASNSKDAYDRVIRAQGEGEELHPNVRRGARPEFEGDVNPKTGEVGGPKNEPLRWGPAGEWTYNGRATDF